MKKSNCFLAAITVVCAMTLTVLLLACTSQNDKAVPDDSSDAEFVIDLDSFVIKPYMQFHASLADVEKYMADNFADYTDETPDSLIDFETDEGVLWMKNFANQNRKIGFYFNDPEGENLKIVNYDYFFPMPISAVMAELERNGFVNKGEVRYDDYNADICYLFLTEDEKTESLLSYWEKDGGSWSISFQLTDPYDLAHLVK